MTLSVDNVRKKQSDYFREIANLDTNPHNARIIELYPTKKGVDSDSLNTQNIIKTPDSENDKEQKKEGFFSSIWSWIKNIFSGIFSKKEENDTTQEPGETKIFPIKNPNKRVQQLLKIGAPIVVNGKLYCGYNEADVEDISPKMLVFNEVGDGYTGKLGPYKYKNGQRVKLNF